MGMNNYFSVCDECRKKLCNITSMDFEQYSLPLGLPVQCHICETETTNWFTDYGIETLKRAIRQCIPPTEFEILQDAVAQLKKTIVIELKASWLCTQLDKLVEYWEGRV